MGAEGGGSLTTPPESSEEAQALQALVVAPESQDIVESSELHCTAYPTSRLLLEEFGLYRYGDSLTGQEAEAQLRDLIAEVCGAGEYVVFSREAVRQGLHAFLTKNPPKSTPEAPQLPSQTLCWASTLLGTLVAQEVLGEGEANSMLESAVTAMADAGEMLGIEEQEMREDAETAMVQQVQTSREQARQLRAASAARAVQVEAAQQRLALQQAELPNPQAVESTRYIPDKRRRVRVKSKQHATVATNDGLVRLGVSTQPQESEAAIQSCKLLKTVAQPRD